jgi:putative DNA methylase
VIQSMSETKYRKKLIEVALPLEAINNAAAAEKSVPRRGHPQTIHLWWARRPLAAARSVLFAQLVDDPSSWPEQFPTEAAQEHERKRLFELLSELSMWENSNNFRVIAAAQHEIARSWARATSHPLSIRIENGDATHAEVAAFLQSSVPPIIDPFTGGGSICIEAQRLGLKSYASDLNPVAVTINTALLVLPQRFWHHAPCHPDLLSSTLGNTWTDGSGLAEDILHYSKRVLQRVSSRISRFYGPVPVPAAQGGGTAVPIGWIWARTVASPNPALRGVHVPLVASFWVSRKKGREVWIEPIVDRNNNTVNFRVQYGPPGPTLEETVNRRGAKCILSGDPIPFSYIRTEAKSGRMRAQLMAVVIETRSGRRYLEPDAAQTISIPEPSNAPTTELPERALGFRVQQYGLLRHRDLFSERQLFALCTFSDVISELRVEIYKDALNAGRAAGLSLEKGGDGASAYADAVVLCLALGLGRLSDYNSTICTWNTIGGSIRSTFARQAIPITWDYFETNPLADTSGSWSSCISWVVDAIRNIHANTPAIVEQRDASSDILPQGIVSTDPPYYDNIGYADLSDFFYIWIRRTAREVFPSLFSTLLVPKASELVATPFRFDGNKQLAKQFFEDGLQRAFTRLHDVQAIGAPLTVYYAFKQAEHEAVGDDAVQAVSSTGWESMLSALLRSGFVVTGTWPIRTERGARTVGLGTNALASSVVLVCRRRQSDAGVATRSDFRRELRAELPSALKALQHGNIAPVDVAQASIGPGMAVFSRYVKVLEANGSAMTVRSALQLINEVLDEHLTEQEGELDADSRFAVTWYENRAFDTGPYGEAETLAKARAVAVASLAEAGIIKSGGGKVRLLKRSELFDDWDPTKDARLTTWEATQHLIKRLEDHGEAAAAELLAKLGALAGAARDLAYRLYSTCERKGWADEARAYNGLVVAWPDLERLATQPHEASMPPAQQRLL